VIFDVILLVVLWGATVVRLPTLLRDRRQRAMWACLCAGTLAETFTFAPVARAIGRPLLADLLGVVSTFLLLRFLAVIAGRGIPGWQWALTAATLIAMVTLDVAAGGTPDPKVAMTQDYCIRWEGTIVPPRTGQYTFAAGGDDGVRLWIDGKQVVDDWGIHQYRERTSSPIQLEAGTSMPVKLEFFQAGGGSKCTLKWIPPATGEIDPDKLFQRAAVDGTTILFLQRPDTWLDEIAKHTGVKSEGVFTIGMDWLGGQFFARKHPLLDGLPVDCAMNWSYQRVVRRGVTRLGMRLEGEELVAGAYESWPMSLGTAIGVINCGKGKVIVSSLDICGALDDTDSTAEVARKMLCNYIRFASQQTSQQTRN